MEKNNLLVEVRDMRNGDWYWVSRLVYEEYAPKIGAIGLALYNAYASYARDKGSAFPSQGRIAKILKISTPTIRKYDKILEKNGLISIDSGKKQGTSNIVYLLKVNGSKQFITPSKSTFHLGSKYITTKEKKIEIKEDKESVPSLKSYLRDDRTFKPFYRGDPIVESPKGSGKLWVIPSDKGKWLEFEGKDEDVEWRLKNNYDNRKTISSWS